MNHEPGKNKILIQCLDISGSMGGSIPSLKEGCLQLGKRYFQGDKRAFEKFITITFCH